MVDNWWDKYKAKEETGPSTAGVVGSPGEGSNVDPKDISGLNELNPIKDYQRLNKARDAEIAGLTTLHTKDRENAAAQGDVGQETKKILNIFRLADKLPETKDIYTGPVAPAWLALGQAARGILPEGAAENIFPSKGAVSSAEILQKLGVHLSIGTSKDLTNRPTQFDFVTNIANNPGILNLPQTRRALVDMLDKHTDRQIDIGNHARDPDLSYKGYLQKKNDIFKDKKYDFEMPKELTEPNKSPTIRLPNGQTITPGH